MSTTPEIKPPTAAAPSHPHRQAIAGSNVVLSLLAALAIVVMVNYLAARHYLRADWTGAGLYTLSDKTGKIVRGLDREVQLYLLWSQADPRYPDVKELVDRYRALSNKLVVEVLDPDLNADRLKVVIGKYGAKLRDLGGGQLAMEAAVIVVSGDNVQFVTASDFEDFSPDDPLGGGGDGDGQKVSGFKAEGALTSAILNVVNDRQPKLCFTQGHGEWAFEGFGARGLGGLTEALRQDGYKTEALATSGASRVPEGCAAVLVVGPEGAFRAEEAALLSSWLDRGGRLVLLLEPVLEGERFAPSGLEDLLVKHGLRAESDLVIETDARRLVSSSPFTFLASELGGHPAVSALKLPENVGAEVKGQVGMLPVVLSTVRGLSRVEGTNAVAEILLQSSGSSWGETDAASLGSGSSVPERSDQDHAGPVAIAAAASVPAAAAKDEGRLVVVGDADFLQDDLLRNDGLYNRDFWSGIVAWVAARPELVSIAPKNPEHVRLNLTAEDVSTLWMFLVGELLLGVLLGIVVWVRRRS